MARCSNALCKRRAEELDDGTRRNESHLFSGYELFEQFHPECCPGVLDHDCDRDHPPGWSGTRGDWNREAPCDPFPAPPLPGPPRIDRIPTRAGGVAEVPSDRALGEDHVWALEAWPGRVRYDGERVRGYARGGFWTRYRIQWARGLVRLPVELARSAVPVLDMVFSDMDEHDRQAACPHPDAAGWRVHIADKWWRCACGAEVPEPTWR